MSTITMRLQRLREALAAHEIDAYLVPSADEHLNEYLPVRRARREFMSGFTGSAGDLVVGREQAWLHVDGRYHLQADEQLEGTGIEAVKLGARGAPRTLSEHLTALARERQSWRLGVDPMVVALSAWKNLEGALSRGGGRLVAASGNLVDAIWNDRPEPAASELIPLPIEWTGASCGAKLAQLRRDLAEAGAEAIVVQKLDQTAWLLNLRSMDDIPFNPVFESFLVVDQRHAHLFLVGGEQRLPDDWKERPQDLVVHAYEAFSKALAHLSGKVLIDPTGTTRGVASALEKAGCELVRDLSPIEKRKAEKNEAEQESQRRANLRASVAKTRALLWLRRELAAGKRVTEATFQKKLEKLYAEQEGYFGLSFNTIAATGTHGAVIHYADCDDTPLESGQTFLIDSGAHIAGGTTDDTRTVAVGDTADPEARRLFTLVLKGHVNCASQVIPEGAAGSALDALARSPLWNAGINYDHGTGHGVGSFLNVHEGPFAIAESPRRSSSALGLRAGMVTSVEPGYYRAGWGGIRLENLYLIQPATGLDDGRAWLRLEPLTFVPFDPTLIDESLLLPAERAWIAEYHRACIEKLSPFLPEAEQHELVEMLGSP